MKKVLISFVLLCMSAFAFSNEVNIFDSGKSKGSVRSYINYSTVFVDAQAMAKKLGGESQFFAQSKQMRIKIKSFTAVINAGKTEIIVNGQQEKLSLPAEITKSKIYIPVDFFLHKALSEALGRQLLFSDGKFCLERFYNIEYLNSETFNTHSIVVFDMKKDLPFTKTVKNKRVAEVEIQGGIFKRIGTVRLKDKFINNFTVKKCGDNECIRFLTSPKTDGWSLEKEGRNLVFKAWEKGFGAAAADASLPAVKREDNISQSDDEDDDGEILAEDSFFSSSAVVIARAKPSAVQTTSKNTKRKMKIVIDPGHGGKDPGATRKYSSTEKDINLWIAKELYALLKKKGFDVKLTRDNDTFLALNQRSKISNEFDADLFVSIHANASKKTAAQGFEVYFRSEKATDSEAAETAAFENEALQYEDTKINLAFADKLLQFLAVNEYINESSKLAGHVRNSVKATAGTGIRVNPNSSIKQANFYVLKGVDSPAILVECGYISNPSDRKQLNTKAVRNKLAEGIYKGILSYAKAEGWQ
ncbi:N-Acetylmuramoyl-L-alanine amidase [Elusimicrobium minutum Pei191]|uniref:N-acetylmuramoyl-L-alanine amidase n=1 Tax=Elusimicrobium minutum (strain Pei191) TaxID=445932 RepID=B2KEH8_ELUMP|nr:N-acetylmuramoyl-L-alanine amidase [Elusimicrobium minutum]ACC98924.1 N-Acetylmuramoyl-L-alanine amidase [Elusimicrobium minutum Pei191]